MNLRERVAKNIIDRRKSIGLSQEGLARQAGLSRAYVGKMVLQNSAYRFEGAQCPIHNPAPTLGEFNEQVFSDVLGLTPDDLTAIEARGIIGTAAVPKGGKAAA